MKIKVNIPYPQKSALFYGHKTSITSFRRLGYTNDWFQIDGATFVLTEVRRCRLSTVALHYFLHEGCGTPKKFVERWTAYHPKQGSLLNKLVWWHKFFRET